LRLGHPQNQASVTPYFDERGAGFVQQFLCELAGGFIRRRYHFEGRQSAISVGMIQEREAVAANGVLAPPDIEVQK